MEKSPNLSLHVQVVTQSIDSLPANSFFTSLATLDSDPLELEVEKLALGKQTRSPQLSLSLYSPKKFMI
jgi:hypothetical protein